MNQPTERSTFVTVVAWILIVASAFATLITLLQTVLVFVVFPSAGMDMETGPLPSDMPPGAAFLFEHLEWLFVVSLIVSVATLASSIGLLRRRNWARLAVAGLMVLGIVWCLGGLLLQLAGMLAAHEQFASVDAAFAEGSPDMTVFFYFFAAVTVLVALGFALLFGWIAKRLLSPAIAAEFQSA